MIDAGVITTPAVGFGSCGEGFIRISLSASSEHLREAAKRIEKLKG
jgi:aspartate/methionine/tyrosine aminotransferase